MFFGLGVFWARPAKAAAPWGWYHLGADGSAVKSRSFGGPFRGLVGSGNPTRKPGSRGSLAGPAGGRHPLLEPWLLAIGPVLAILPRRSTCALWVAYHYLGIRRDYGRQDDEPL